MSGRSLFVRGFVACLLATSAWMPVVAQSTAATATSTTTSPVPDQPPAAGPENAAPAADSTIGASGDIVVTARRAAESIQRTPVSITAFTADTLRSANITKTSDLMTKTPGVFLAGSGGRENSVFSIRGQSKALSGPGAAAVVSYFAEVPSPTFSSGLATYDMSSVQVLKGPQGTLFGRNTTGGAVLYYPTAPTYDFGGYVEGSYARFDHKTLEGALTVPIINDVLSIRVSGQYDKRDAYTRNLASTGDRDGINSRAIRGSVLFEPTATVRNTTIYDYYRNTYNGDSFSLAEVKSTPSLLDAIGVREAMLAQLAAQRDSGRNTVTDDMPGVERVRRTGVTNRTEFDLGDKTQFVNIFGYRRVLLRYNANVDGVGVLPGVGGLPFVVLNAGIDTNIRQITDEVQLKGKLFDDRLDWLLGGFYLDSKPIGTTGTFASVATIPGVTHGNFAYNFYSEKSKALFGNINYKLDSILEGLRFNAGFRYTWDKVSACTAADPNEIGTASPRDCEDRASYLLSPATTKASSSAPTWSFGLDYQVTPDVFTYVVSRRGYRAGGVNSPTLGGTLTSAQVFKPEKVTDVEAGIRSTFRLLGMRTRFNVSGFSGYYQDVQIVLTGVQTTRPGCVAGDPVLGAAPYTPDGDCNTANDPASGTLLTNAGKSRVSGIDFDGAVNFTSSLQFTFGGNVLDTATRKFAVLTALRPYVGSNHIPFLNSPKSTFTAGLNYTHQFDELGQLALNADFYHSSKVQVTAYSLPSYENVNLRASLNNLRGLPVDVSVFATNALNKRYQAFAGAGGTGLGFTTVHFAEPAQYGVTLRYRIGG